MSHGGGAFPWKDTPVVARKNSPGCGGHYGSRRSGYVFRGIISGCLCRGALPGFCLSRHSLGEHTSLWLPFIHSESIPHCMCFCRTLSLHPCSGRQSPSLERPASRAAVHLSISCKEFSLETAIRISCSRSCLTLRWSPCPW